MDDNTITPPEGGDLGEGSKTSQDPQITPPNDGADDSSKESKGSGESLTIGDYTDEDIRSFAKGQGIDDLDKLSDREKRLMKISLDSRRDLDKAGATKDTKKSDQDDLLSQLRDLVSGGKPGDKEEDTEKKEEKLSSEDLVNQLRKENNDQIEEIRIENKLSDIKRQRPEVETLITNGELGKVLKEKPYLWQDLDLAVDQALKIGGSSAYKEAIEAARISEREKISKVQSSSNPSPQAQSGSLSDSSTITQADFDKLQPGSEEYDRTYNLLAQNKLRIIK